MRGLFTFEVIAPYRAEAIKCNVRKFLYLSEIADRRKLYLCQNARKIRRFSLAQALPKQMQQPFLRKAKLMNSKSILTKTILTLCVSALLMLQPAFAQIGKAKKAMTPGQIEAFLKEAQKKKWQVTVKTSTETFSGTITDLNIGSNILLEDAHPLLAGSCGVEVNKKWPFPINFKDIVYAEKRNLLALGLRSTGEISFSALFIAMGVVATPIIAVTDAIKKN